MSNSRYKRLYEQSKDFRETADILKRANWSDEDILTEWDNIQNDNELGYDGP